MNFYDYRHTEDLNFESHDELLENWEVLYYMVRLLTPVDIGHSKWRHYIYPIEAQVASSFPLF